MGKVGISARLLPARDADAKRRRLLGRPPNSDTDLEIVKKSAPHAVASDPYPYSKM